MLANMPYSKTFSPAIGNSSIWSDPVPLERFDFLEILPMPLQLLSSKLP